MMTIRFFTLLIITSLLVACANQKTIVSDSAPLVHPANIEHTPDAIPKVEARSRGGNRASYEVFGKTYYVLPTSENFVQRGVASWYGTKFHGNKTANGEIYNMYEMTAAHKTLPIPTYVEVTNVSTGKKIIVRVNDRGPFHDDRIIDLSYAAAAKLGTLKNGTSSVEVRAINPLTYQTTSLTTPTVKQNQAAILKPVIEQPLPPSDGFLFIQVGAFNSTDNANKLKHELFNLLKMPITIKPSTHLSEPLYLVRLGPYTEMKEADSARLKLQKLGYKNAIYTDK